MIQTLFALGTVCALSSATRLLQQYPNPELYLPVQPAPPVVIPPPVIPPPPYDPPVPSPHPEVPVVVVEPVAPAPAEPVWTVSPASLECRLSPPAPGSCAGNSHFMQNPMENFELFCDGYEACTGAIFNINYTPTADPNIEVIKGLIFKGEYVAAGAVINLSNHRGGAIIQIDEIVCDMPGACMEAQFIFGPLFELEVGDFVCGADSCRGCIVRESITSPGVPCADYSEPI